MSTSSVSTIAGGVTASTISRTTIYGEIARDLVTAGGSFVAAKHRAGILQPEGVSTVGRSGHPGAPAHSLDVDADQFMREALRQVAPEAIYLSEESASGVNLVPGKLLFHCDPIDGTTLLRSLGFGWAVVGYFEKVRSDGKSVAHLGGAIYIAGGPVISWARTSREGYVRLDFPPVPAYDVGSTIDVPEAADVLSFAGEQQTIWLERGDDDEAPIHLRSGDARYVAPVAASPARRAGLLDRYDVARTNLWTLGGNPAIGALLVLELGATIEVESVELHDGVFLVPLKIAGGHIEALDGYLLDVVSIFESIDPERRLPPFIAAADPDVARHIRALRRI